METIAGFLRTGRTTLGPGADLIELSSDDGFRHTAIVFHPACREHPAIGPALEVVKGYLEAPYVTGLLELTAHEREAGAFVYPTGEAWSVAEVVRILGDQGRTGGIRAGLELMYAAGQVLGEAAESGEQHGVYSHGGLTPWRVMLKGDGQVEIMGYALPQVEILQFHANPDEVPREDSFRYCPPERMEGQSEDLTADLFGLALIAFELMTGKPVYDGLVTEIRTQASRAEGSRRLFRYKDKLSRSVRDLLTVCLRARPEDRHGDGETFLEAVSRVLSSKDATGPSLMDLMAEIQKVGRRSGTKLDTGKTLGMSRDELARMLNETTSPAVTVEEKQRVEEEAEKPWGRSTRRRRKEATSTASPEPSPPPPPPVVVQDAPSEAELPGEQTLPSEDVQRPEPPPVAQEPPQQPWSRPARRRPRRKGELSEAADAIIARITHSGDQEAPSAPPPSRPNARSAADVIEAILQSSTSGDRPVTEPSIPRLAAEDLQKDLEPSTRPRRVRKRRKTPKAPPKESLEPVHSTSYAESGAWRSTAEDPEPSFSSLGPPVSQAFGSGVDASEEVLPGEDTAPTPTPEPASESPAEEEPPTGPVNFGDDAPAPQPAPAPADGGLQPISASPMDEATEQRPPPVAPTLVMPVEVTSRPPDSLPPLSGGKGRSYRIRRGPTGRPLKTRIPGRMTLSEAVTFLVGTAVPIRTDLQGRIRESYRLGPESGPGPGDTPINRFPEDSTLILHPVPAREVWVDLEVRDGEPSTCFKVPVNVALSACSVVDAIAAWLELPPGRWTLFAGEVPVGPHTVLDEVDLEKRLTLRR